MGQVIRGTLPVSCSSSSGPAPSSHALQKSASRNAMMIRHHHTAVPQSQLCNKCRRHSRSPLASTAITPEGLQGLRSVSGLRLCSAARRNCQQDGHGQRGIPQPDRSRPRTGPVSASVEQGQIDHAARKTPSITLRIIEVKINRFIGFLPLISDRLSGIHPRKRKFLQCIHHIAICGGNARHCAACLCAFLLPGAGTLAL